MIEEVLLDVVTRSTDIRVAAMDHALHPGQVGDRLAAADRVGVGSVGVAAFRLAQFRVVHQHGEQDVTRVIGECRIDRTERGARLIGIGVRREDCVDHGVAASVFA